MAASSSLQSLDLPALSSAYLNHLILYFMQNDDSCAASKQLFVLSVNTEDISHLFVRPFDYILPFVLVFFYSLVLIFHVNSIISV